MTFKQFSNFPGEPIFLCPDRNIAITSNTKDNISIWNLIREEKAPLFSWDVPHKTAFVIDRETIIAINNDGYVSIINIESQIIKKEIAFAEIKDFNYLNVYQNGNFLLYACNNEIAFWDCIRGGQVQLIPFSAKYIANACKNTNVCIFETEDFFIAWDLETQKQIDILEQDTTTAGNAHLGFVNQEFFVITFTTGEILILDIADKRKHSFNVEKYFDFQSIESKEDCVLISDSWNFFLINIQEDTLKFFHFTAIYWVVSNLIIAVKENKWYLIDPWSNKFYEKQNWPEQLSLARNVFLKDNRLHFTDNNKYREFDFNTPLNPTPAPTSRLNRPALAD